MNASVSFTLDDLEQSNIEAAANQPGRDDIFTCTCSGVCLRESGIIPAHVEVHISSARLVATKEPLGTCA